MPTIRGPRSVAEALLWEVTLQTTSEVLPQRYYYYL